MEKIDLSPHDIIALVAKKERIIGQGANGIVMPYNDDSLIKIYYQNIFESLDTLDEVKLSRQINKNKEINLEINKILISYKDIVFNENKKLALLEQIGLVKGQVYCDDYLIGVLLNYYQDYYPIDSIINKLSLADRINILKNIKLTLNYLMLNNLYPEDIKESNILVHLPDLDVKMIDLDADGARYEDKDYKYYPNIKDNCLNNYNVLKRRLLKTQELR
jgi:serine/threonine protein kinase